MRGRTLWLVGDSRLGIEHASTALNTHCNFEKQAVQELMRALQCFFYEFWDLDTRALSTLVPNVSARARGGGVSRSLAGSSCLPCAGCMCVCSTVSRRIVMPAMCRLHVKAARCVRARMRGR